MKTKELIKQLNEADPEGNSEVNIHGSGDIFHCESLPGYYDGCYEILIRNKGKEPFYNLEGIMFTKEGSKVIIKAYDFKDGLWDNNGTFPIIFDKSMDEHSKERILNEYLEEKEIVDKYIKNEKETHN